MQDLIELVTTFFQRPLDLIGFLLYLIVFPIYHGLYPVLARLLPGRTRKGRIDLYRRSWIASLLESRNVIEGAQQTRNLTMVASFLASSALILLGVTANVLLRGGGGGEEQSIGLEIWRNDPAALQMKLYLLMVVFSGCFIYFMSSLRHLGHFNLVIGADPALIEREEGVPAVDYITRVINLASNRYTLGLRSFYSAMPLFLWIFSTWIFLLATVVFAMKFLGVSDFARKLCRPTDTRSA